MIVRVEGIVIRAADYGEGNKIVTLATRQMGKLSVMARGAKKAQSRHAAATQPFTYGDYSIYKSGQMGTLNSAELIASHRHVREQLHAAAYAAYIAEMTDRLYADGEGGGMAFEQLLAAFAALEEGKDAVIITHIMEMKMLAAAGYLPETESCVSCGRQEGPMAASAGQGGLLCADCRRKDPAAVPLGPAALKLLRLFGRMDLRRLGDVKVGEETKAQLARTMRSFMDTYVDVRWKSRSFLDQMAKYDL